jgi:hypothetical protein
MSRRTWWLAFVACFLAFISCSLIALSAIAHAIVR